MKIYSYIKRIRNIEKYKDIKDMLWTTKYNKIIKVEKELILKGYCVTIKKDIFSNDNDIKEFYELIYLPLINSKKYPNVIDIVNRINQWIEKKKRYIYIEIKDNKWIIIWGTILSFKENWDTLTSWFLATWYWYEYLYEYMEYLFFQYAIQYNFRNISLWTTSNLCWYNQWSWITVVIRQKTLPIITRKEKTQNIDLNNINKESIIFLSDNNKECNKVIVLLPKTISIEDKEKYSLLEKRGLDIKYNYF